MSSSAGPTVALLGYSCRLPGAADPEGFWRLLVEGRSAIGRIGPDRWSAASFFNPDRGVLGSSYTMAAGLLDDPFGFDAAFFGLSPREAAQMDPQQRLLLHVAWEAVERAGLAPARLSGPRTGVYVGVSGLDYSNTLLGDPELCGSHFMTGNTLSIVANRLAFLLDAQGPSFVIDTACSSSLFAFHEACEAIRRGEIDRALVGGVNMLLSPMPFVGFSRAGMLSPSGFCHAFDAAADGYVRSEGAVCFVLGRLDEAQAGGDPIQGVVAASGVNSDGRAGLLTVPNGARQAELMRAVWRDADIPLDDVAFVEAHGTGTPVGDPIEARAIGEVLGSGRSRPLPIGSVKANVGHLEPAAGLVGLLKAQLALEKHLYPGTAGLNRPNPNIPFEALNLVAPTDPTVIPLREQGCWAAGVNSFGFGGANAHVVIRRPRPLELQPSSVALREDASLVISAASASALKALVERWCDRLDAADSPREAAALVSAAAYRKPRLAHRLAVAEGDPKARRDALRGFLDGKSPARAATAVAPFATAPVAFVFSGNGSQWAGMGVAAYRDDPAFRESFDRTAEAVLDEGGPDIRQMMVADDLEARLGDAMTAQTLLIGLQIALADSLRAQGVRPAATMGHSVGEVAAAWAAGAITRSDAARLAVRRAAAQAPLRGAGGMAAVLASVEDVESLIAEAGAEELGVAAENSPRGATVSGSFAALGALSSAARRRRIAVRRLKVEHPFHGPVMERIRDRLLADLTDISPRIGAATFVSATDGGVRAGDALDAEYWWRNARERVRFRQAALALSDLGCGVFLEIGPQPVLQNYLTDSLSAEGRTFIAIPSFRRQGAGGEDVRAVTARVLAAGGATDEEVVFGRAGPAIDAPMYPWELKPYRLAPGTDSLNLLRRPAPRPLLGWRARADEGPWRATLEPATHPWLSDHVVDGAPALPAAAFLEMAAAAGLETFGDVDLEIRNFEVSRPAVFERGARLEFRTSFESSSGAVRIESRSTSEESDWTLHAAGEVRQFEEAPAPPPARVDGGAVDAAGIYHALLSRGLAYGPTFARVQAVQASGDAASADLGSPTVEGRWAVDPTAVDAAFHLVAPLVRNAAAEAAFVPVRIGRFRLWRGGEAASAAARLVRRGARTLMADFTLLDDQGRVRAEVGGVRFQAVRLRRGGRGGGRFWRETLRPARAVAFTSTRWPTPLERLHSLDLVEDARSEPDDATLLLDAVARRVVWDSALALAPEGGVRFRARKVLTANLRRALETGLNALADDGSYDPAADRALDIAPAPELRDLARAVAVEAPERVDLLIALLRLRDLMSGLRSPEADLMAPASRAAEEVWPRLRDAAAEILRDAPEGAAPTVLLMGKPPTELAATVEAAGAGWVAAVGNVSRRPAASPPADLILVEDLEAVDASEIRAISEALRPGGFILTVARRVDLPHALLAAAGGRGSDEGGGIAGRLAAAGLQVAAGEAGGADAGLVAARRPAEDGHEPSPQRRSVAILSASDAATPVEEARLRRALEAAGIDIGDPAGAAELVVIVPRGGGSKAVAAKLDALRRTLAQGSTARVWTLARGAHPAAQGPHDPVAAAFARALRSVVNERAGLDLRVIDLGAEPDDAGLAAAAAEMAAPSQEPWLVLDGRRRLAPRVEPAEDVEATRSDGSGADARRLEADPLGGLETLTWKRAARRAPGPGEVEIEVRASGLNFRDVMWAMGALPEEAIEEGFSGFGLGMECAGVVVRVGEGAEAKLGDRVIAFARDSFASYVTTAESAVGPLPEGVDFAAAATLPVAFATAWRGLVDLGRLAEGETVLIHGGAGGVGLAALQIARARGARIFATAGTPEKRDFLEMLGAEAAFDSRSLAFAEGVMSATNGRGVDVALNSLSGAAMERTLDCVAAFGRFVELGKRDFYANTRLGMRPLRRNISYFGVDLDAMLAARPDTARPLLAELSRALAAGEIAPLPYRVEPGEEAVAAFRLMQRSGHVGKIVLTPPMAVEAASPARAVAAPAPLAREDGAYLVTGGTRGFGLRFAERLVERGARRLWLTGLTGKLTEEAAAAVDRMRSRGVSVEVVACDASDVEAARALFGRIEAAGAPLRGVAHAAMRLDDALLQNLDAERIAATLRPKLDGALVLDALTREPGRRETADWFLLFSSVSAVFGNPGQSSYVAANAGLESLAAARRVDGLPGFAAQFGPISDSGVLAEDERARARLERKGAGVLSSAEALDLVEMAMRSGRDATLALAPMRWALLKDELHTLSTPLFERIDLESEAAAAGAADALIERIGAMGESEAAAAATQLLRAEAAAILRLQPDEVDIARPLSEIGFDSLMAVELKLSVEEKFGITVPALAISDGATLSALAARIARDLRGAAAPAEEGAAAALAARHLDPELSGVIESRLASEEAAR